MSFRNNAILMGYASNYQFGETSSGKTYCSFSLFVVDKYNDKEVKNYFNVVCYSNIAEIVKRYHENNKHLLVDGSIKPYKDNKDNDRFDIVAKSITFI